jgi:acyl-[acyl-carrier-protein] desaturase
MTGATFLQDLLPTVETLLERHLATAKEWFPHEFVPWSRGRDFDPGEEWDPSGYEVAPGVRSALFVNLLTEDNLPYYFNVLDRTFGEDGAWGEWARRWTAEEGRHSIVLRDYMTVTRALDPIALERARMHQVSGGRVPRPASAADGLVYVALQELATRIAHRNTGKLLADKVGYNVIARVASDENLHFLFYRDLVSAAIAADPSPMVMAIERQVRGFEMPGTGIDEFAVHARAIAKAGIYDLRLHHEQILVPVVLQHWCLAALEGLDDEAERARAATIKRIERIERAGRRFSERSAEQKVAASI